MTSDRPTILYIHGLNSSPLSQKARQLSAALTRIGMAGCLRVPALHHHPRRAIAQLETELAVLGRPLLVGSSLGGYYATHLAERHGLRALLINPAVLPHRRFDGYLGPQTNLYSGEVWELTHDHVVALAELEVPPPQDAGRYQVWLQTGDETLDYRQAVDLLNEGAAWVFYRFGPIYVGSSPKVQGFTDPKSSIADYAKVWFE